MTRFLLSILSALLLMTAVVPAAWAAPTWCEDDPGIVVTVPGWAPVTVYVTIAGEARSADPAVVQAVQAAVNAAGVLSNGGQLDSSGKWGPQLWLGDIELSKDGTAARVDAYVVVHGAYPYDSSFLTRAAVSTGPNGTGQVLTTTHGHSDETMRLRFWLTK